MLEITRIRTEKEQLIEALKKRNIDVTDTMNQIIEKDQQWRSKKTSLETIAADLNKIAKEIGDLFKSGKASEAEAAKQKTSQLKEDEAILKQEVDALDKDITELLYQIPNVPNELVKAGKNEEDNETVEEVGTRKPLHADALPHWELAKKYNLIDFELGVKITGAGFPIYRGKGAKLQRALIQFFLDEAEKA
ncbi:MAG: serine--tRNA ligase, partial [Fluviicola sp.]